MKKKTGLGVGSEEDVSRKCANGENKCSLIERDRS